MTDRPDSIAAVRTAIFGPPLIRRQTLELVEGDPYWDLHEAELRQHFEPEAFFDRSLLIEPDRLERQRRARSTVRSDAIADHWLIRATDGSLAGMVATCQRDHDTFELLHVNLHPSQRGTGLYAEVLERVLAFAERLGFLTTVSVHSPSNNAVLIRHLKAGFRFVAFEIDALYGPSVRLACFHDPRLLQAFEYRCGMAVMDDHLHAAGTGHFALLDEQFAAARTRTR